MNFVLFLAIFVQNHQLELLGKHSSKLDNILTVKFDILLVNAKTGLLTQKV